MAGKGRTGTVICCYLLFTGRFKKANDAFNYYSSKRFSKGEGVTQPSQRRYVYYFEKLLNEKIYFPLVRTITSITMNKIPFVKNDGYIKTYFEVFIDNGIKVSNNRIYNTQFSYLTRIKQSMLTKLSFSLITPKV